MPNSDEELMFPASVRALRGPREVRTQGLQFATFRAHAEYINGAGADVSWHHPA